MTAALLTAGVAAPTTGARLSRYASLGDSFTAGHAPDGDRWTDRLAGRFARSNPDLVHTSFAQPGATSADVLERQVPRALEFAPDLVTVVCGVNDVLLAPQPDLVQYAAHLKKIVCAIREGAPGAIVVTATCPNHASGLPLTERVRERLENAVELLNEVTRSLAGRLDVPYVDFRTGRRPPAAASAHVGVCHALWRTDSQSVAEAFARLVEAAGEPQAREAGLSDGAA